MGDDVITAATDIPMLTILLHGATTVLRVPTRLSIRNILVVCRFGVADRTTRPKPSRTDGSDFSKTRSAAAPSLGDAAALGISRNVIDQQLHKMVKDGEVVAVSRGRYAHPDKTERGV